MRFLGLCFLLVALSGVCAQSSTNVDFEMMTWVEVKQALQEGKLTALIYNGGTEQRGPQNVNGGHTLMGHATAIAIAQKLGNAIVAPTMPFSPNNADPNLPGTIGLTPALFASLNERVAEQMIKNGFKNIVLMGDHGGGQRELGDVASKLNNKYSTQGIRVVFCDDVYAKANADFDKYLEDQHLPISKHAGIPDTSEMLYLGGGKGWVRKDHIKSALGDPVVAGGTPPDQNVKRVNNGIQGDARASTPELGKKIFDMKVDYAVKQIARLLGDSAGRE